MQSIFRLPWCSEQMKLSEKAGLDKMRAAPVVEIPALHHQLKRKLSDGSSHLPQQPKKPRTDAEYPQQLPTPSSPFADARLFTQATTTNNNSNTATTHAGRPLHAPSHVDTTPVTSASSGATSTSDDQNRAHADIKSGLAASEAPSTVLPADHSTAEGYFAAKPLLHQSADMAAQNTLPDSLSGLTPLQQVIDNEFNMQILMKHNELRLIEQELAKCQVALEQLRRCELRPFPGSAHLAASVSEGTGPSIAPPPGFSRPTHPPPYGVTDGPYSRHYRQWLLHDPQFDSMSPQAIAHAEHLANAANRPTRNTGHARKTGSKSLATTTRAAEPLHSIPNYASPTVKDKNTPLVLKRSTDNKMVKLICKDCKRGNFSSIQGFLNHCRIAHKVDYKSHDAAAIDCGQLLEAHEMVNLPQESHPVSAPKMAPSRNVSVPNLSNKNFVHPLNTPAATPVNTPGPKPAFQIQSNATPVPKLHIPAPRIQSNATFKASNQLPYLSAHFAKHKVVGNLEQAIENAKQKIDFGTDDEFMTPDTPDTGSPMAPFQGGKRMPSAGAGAMRPGTQDGNTGLVPRPSTCKGFRQQIQRPRPAPLAPAPARNHDMIMNQSTLSSPHDLGSASLSPHVTDNPGLVSDHEDDDHGSASDEESSQVEAAAPSRHPLPSVGRTCEDHMDIDVEEDDEIDQHGVIIRRNSMLASEARGIRGAESPSRKMGGK